MVYVNLRFIQTRVKTWWAETVARPFGNFLRGWHIEGTPDVFLLIGCFSCLTCICRSSDFVPVSLLGRARIPYRFGTTLKISFHRKNTPLHQVGAGLLSALSRHVSCQTALCLVSSDFLPDTLFPDDVFCSLNALRNTQPQRTRNLEAIRKQGLEEKAINSSVKCVNSWTDRTLY